MILLHVTHRMTLRSESGTVKVVYDTVPVSDPITMTLDPPVPDHEIQALEESTVIKLLRDGE